jgi:hypothetical protein
MQPLGTELWTDAQRQEQIRLDALALKEEKKYTKLCSKYTTFQRKNYNKIKVMFAKEKQKLTKKQDRADTHFNNIAKGYDKFFSIASRGGRETDTVLRRFTIIDY